MLNSSSSPDRPVVTSRGCFYLIRLVFSRSSESLGQTSVVSRRRRSLSPPTSNLQRLTFSSFTLSLSSISSAVVPVSEKGQRILGFLYRLFYFDFTILQLSVHVRITQNSTMSAASLQDPPIEDPEGTSRTVNNTKDSILALGTSVEAAMDLVQFLVDQLASILPIAQDIITIGVASAAVFLARVSKFASTSFVMRFTDLEPLQNAQRVGRGGELTTLLLQAARTCRSVRSYLPLSTVLLRFLAEMDCAPFVLGRQERRFHGSVPKPILSLSRPRVF